MKAERALPLDRVEQLSWAKDGERPGGGNDNISVGSMRCPVASELT